MRPSSGTAIAQAIQDLDGWGKESMRHAQRQLGALTAAAVVLAGVTGTALAQEPVRTVLHSLEPGETILHRESMMALTAEAADVVL